MQCIDIPTLIKGPVPHAAEFQVAAKSIAHFVANAKFLKGAFGFSAATTDQEEKRLHLRSQLEASFAKNSYPGKGFVVALNDPVALANDLSELTMPTSYAGFDESAHRGSVCLRLLESLEAGIRAEARTKAQAQNLTVDQVKKRADSILLRGAPIPRGGLERTHNTPEERDRAIAAEEQKAWDEIVVDGKPLLDTARIKQFPGKYEAALHAFEPIQAKLATAHCAMLKCDQLSRWMSAVHDDEDVRSGFAYRESLAQCIGNGVKNGQCKEVLLGWLGSLSAQDTKNLLGRALLFNQAEIVDATVPHLKVADFPVEGILNLYKRALARVSKTEASRLVDNLVLTIANVFVDVLSDPKLLRPGVFVLRNLVIVGLSIFGGVVVRPRNMSVHDLRDWILRQARSGGLNLSQSRQQMRAAAHKVAETALKQRSVSSVAFALELDMERLAGDGVISEKVMGPVQIPGVEQSKTWLGSSSPEEFRLGVVTSIVQLIALGFALKDLSENDRFNEFETRYKLSFGGLTLLATITESIALTAEKSRVHPLSQFLFNHWASLAENSRGIALAARSAGAVAGLMLAAFDFYKAVLAFSSGRNRLGGIYSASGITGTALGGFALMGLQALWPFLIVAVIWAILLPYLNAAALQVWVGRCYFGTDAEKFLTIDEELKSFNSAVGG